MKALFTPYDCALLYRLAHVPEIRAVIRGRQHAQDYSLIRRLLRVNDNGTGAAAASEHCCLLARSSFTPLPEASSMAAKSSRMQDAGNRRVPCLRTFNMEFR